MTLPADRTDAQILHSVRPALIAAIRALHAALAGNALPEADLEARLRDAWAERDRLDALARDLRPSAQSPETPPARPTTSATPSATPAAAPPVPAKTQLEPRSRPLDKHVLSERLAAARPAPPPPPSTTSKLALHLDLAPPTATAPEPPPPKPAPPPALPPSAASLQALVANGLHQPGPEKPMPSQRSSLDLLLRGLPTGTEPDPDIAARRLRALIDDRKTWLTLPVDDHKAVLQAVVAVARALQERGVNLDATFHTLTAWSKLHEPGTVWGLRRTHGPKHGTWDRDAALARRTLQPLPFASFDADIPSPEAALDTVRDALTHGTDLPTAVHAALRSLRTDDTRLLRLLSGRAHQLPGSDFKKLRRLLRDAATPEPNIPDDTQDETLIPPDWPHLARTTGRHLALVGGDRRPEAQARIVAAFRFASSEWHDPADVRKLASLAARIRQGNIGFVLFLHRFSSHKADHILMPAVKESGTPWAPVETGYGVNQIRLAIERFSS